MNAVSRAARHHLVLGVVCGLFVVLGLLAIRWSHEHRYQEPTAAPTSNAAQNTPVAAPSSPSPSSTSRKTGRSSPVAAPSSVMIPKLGLDEKLLSLGLDAAGAIAVPSGADVHRVAWYHGSVRPGQPGPAVIEGHVITPDGRGPFHDLGTLHAGDDVTVRDAAGREHTFTVYRLARYPKNDFPTAEVYGNTAGAELRLITCSGTFDTRTGHYDSNTVVYAR